MASLEVLAGPLTILTPPTALVGGVAALFRDSSRMYALAAICTSVAYILLRLLILFRN